MVGIFSKFIIVKSHKSVVFLNVKDNTIFVYVNLILDFLKLLKKIMNIPTQRESTHANLQSCPSNLKSDYY